MASSILADTADLLPESRAESQSIMVPTGTEHRKSRRYYFRTLATATIYPPVGVEGQPQVCYVLTRDLSRSGISFLHPAPLFSSQRIDLSFPSGQQLTVEIQRITLLEPGCILFGCKLRPS